MSSRHAFYFLLPALVLYVAFVVVPILQMVAYSFFSWDNGIAQGVVGLANYARLGSDGVFWEVRPRYQGGGNLSGGSSGPQPGFNSAIHVAALEAPKAKRKTNSKRSKRVMMEG